MQFPLGGRCDITALGLSISQDEPVAAVAAIFSIAGLFLYQPSPDQIVQSTLDGAAGELQVSGNRPNGGPAVQASSRTVAKVHIDGSRPMGKLIGRGRIKMVEITHEIPPSCFKYRTAAHGVLSRFYDRCMKGTGSS